jgi:hypothetical protein
MIRPAAPVAAVLLALGAMWAEPAAAQDWNIYVLGAVDPIVADFYHDGDPPWIVFHYKGDASMYVFAVGCNKVVRVDRGGTPVALLPCPVERLVTSVSRVYVSLLELEGKRLDDGLARLRELTTAYARALADASFAEANVARTPGSRLPVAGMESSLALLRSQLDEASGEVEVILRRVGTLSGTIADLQRIERQEFPPPRFFFAPR